MRFLPELLNFSELMASGNLIDVDRAKTEYGKAHEYFAQGDFQLAEKGQYLRADNMLLRQPGIFF